MGGVEPALSIQLDHPWSASCPDPESRAGSFLGAAPPCSFQQACPSLARWSKCCEFPTHGLTASQSLQRGGEGKGRCLVTLGSRRPRLTVGEKYSQASRVCTPKRARPEKSTVY